MPHLRKSMTFLGYKEVSDSILASLSLFFLSQDTGHTGSSIGKREESVVLEIRRMIIFGIGCLRAQFHKEGVFHRNDVSCFAVLVL
mmetsp:Transcript_2819/g.3871  ORF Transcript_2819/g.3871 Transcript_2819/m.3871 type:complete len:86 (+) Transcript_2819:1286-1543(+)